MARSRSTSPLGAVSLVDALVARVHERIADETFVGGQAITEALLVAEFDISRPTARSAIAAAVTMGLLAQDPNRPATVPLVTADAVRDIFRVRIPLELEAVRLLTADPRLVGPSAPESVRRLAELGNAPLAAFSEEDLRFHRELMRSSGSDRLVHHWMLLEKEVQLAMLQAKRPIRADKVSDEHRGILRAIDSGDWSTAYRAAHDHLKTAREELAHLLPG